MTQRTSVNGNIDRIPALSFGDRRREVAHQVENTLLQQIRERANDPEEQNRLYQQMTVDMLTNVETLLDASRKEVSAFGFRLANDVSGHPRAGTVEEIVNGILQAPDMDVESGQSHPFFTMETVSHRDQGEWTWSQINLPKLARYREDLSELAIAFPEKSAELNQLDGIIARTMELAGPRYQVFEWKKREGKRYSEQAAGEMFKMAAFIAAAAAAAITGTIAIANRKFSAAPLLYAGVAVLIASPNLRTMLFGREGEASLAKIDGVLNNKAFLRTCRDYDVQDTTWEQIARNTMNNEEAVRDFRRALSNAGGDSRNVPQDTVDTFVDAMTGTDVTAKKNLHRMIADNRFEGFAAVLEGGKSEDEQQVILDYIRMGSWTYAKNLDAVEHASNRIIGGQHL